MGTIPDTLVQVYDDYNYVLMGTNRWALKQGGTLRKKFSSHT
jgi:hypothetical protein